MTITRVTDKRKQNEMLFEQVRGRRYFMYEGALYQKLEVEFAQKVDDDVIIYSNAYNLSEGTLDLIRDNKTVQVIEEINILIVR